MDAPDMLSRITIHALHYPRFRDAWESALRDATAQAVESVGWYEADVPVPEGMDRTDVKVAFALAVDCAVERELRARSEQRG